MRPPRLRVRALSKTFPGVRALQEVSLEVQPGEVHALLGENGAGKSTLVKIISGVESPDGGEIELDGQALRNLNEAAAGALGIGIVHQEGSLVPQLSLAENIFAGRQPVTRFGTVDRKAMNARAEALLEDLHITLHPETLVRDLSPAEAQSVEIAKALSRELRLLILDEPTAALTIAETERLFAVVRTLAAQGVAVIYISHRLAEVFTVCKRVTVLKDGRVSGTREVARTTQDDLIQLMVGREVKVGRADDADRKPGQAVLEVRRLASSPMITSASLTVREGEIVCLAGLIGAGRTELCETVFGARRRTGGEVHLMGRPAHFSSPWEAMKAGVGMVPEDRKEAGLFLDMSVTANVGVTNLERVSSGGLISERKHQELAQRFVTKLRVATPSLQQAVGYLSGGNQQKVLLAKWLAREPRLLIVDEPTRGVDVGARAEIYDLLRELAAQGVAVLVVSSDLPEVLSLADRIVVMAEGETVGELSGDGASEIAVLRLAARFQNEVVS